MNRSKLSLIEYSNKYNVSISTLRRRIKDHSIDFTEENGKYFILENGAEALQTESTLDTHKVALKKAIEEKVTRPMDLTQNQQPMGFSAAAQMLEELKRAYTQILHEREEQIVQLKEEISDLKTLVRVLESYNKN